MLLAGKVGRCMTLPGYAVRIDQHKGVDMKQTDQTTSGKAGCCAAASQDAGAGAPCSNVTPEERRDMIATAAYYRAECRGFAECCELEDWLAAEAEIDQFMRQD